MNKRSNLLILTAIFVMLASATAKAETFYAYLSGAQEVPVSATTATGYARVFINESTGVLSFTVVFTGLSSAQTASHIHAPAAIGANAAVAINFGTVGGTSGTITGSTTVTPTQLAQIRAHQGYVNVHSTTFPGGEIRGQLGIKRPVDFDGDGRQDFSILRFPGTAPPATNQITYYNLNSTTGPSAAVWGDANTDFPTPGDYDGDGKDDLALYRAGATAGAQSTTYIFRSSNGTALVVPFGVNGDQAVSRDYDGDGITDCAIFRTGAAPGAQAVWWIRKSGSGNAQFPIPWGTTGDGINNFDTPVPGDYDGDGKFDVAVYRFALTPANTFIVQRSSDGAAVYQQFGNFSTDYVLPGDYDGDGKYDFAVARTGAQGTSPMVWWILKSSTGTTLTQQFGLTSDTPVQGDYDGDARTDIAVFRRGATAAAQSTFWVSNSFNGTATATQWGLGADFPVASFDVR
ncbi:hypothetical protein BH10ACI3_BH10ACI3_26780 [soil metagenome]